MTSQPSFVTTTSSSSRAADQPSDGGPVGFERKDHAFFDHFGIIERNQAAEDRFLPDRQTDAVAVLQRKSGFFIGEAELLRLGPELDHVGRGDARFDDADRRVHVVAATFVGVDHRRRGAADCECSVIAGAIAIVAVQNIEERRIAGTQHAVGVDMRMRAATLAGNRIDAFDMLGAEIVQHFADHADAFVFFNARFHEAIKLVVGGIDHHGRGVEQSDLVLGFDLTHFVHELLAVDDFDALRL